MHATIRVAFGLVPFLAGVPAQGQDSLYRIRSRDLGIEAFDLTVTETKRTPRTSVVAVPGFHEGSAAARQWLMCVYTHLALRRGFKYWAVVYPEPPGVDLLVGFPETVSEDVSRTLGPEFVKDRTIPPKEVEWFQSNLCGNLNGWPTGSENRDRATAAAASPVAAEQAHVAAMKSDLRNLLLAEEVFWADSGRYSSIIGPRAVNLRLSEGNTLRSLRIIGDGWTAEIVRAGTQTVCAIYVGSTPIAPAKEEEIPACDPEAPVGQDSVKGDIASDLVGDVVYGVCMDMQTSQFLAEGHGEKSQTMAHIVCQIASRGCRDNPGRCKNRLRELDAYLKQSGMSMLYAAAYSGSTDIVKAMTAMGSDPNAAVTAAASRGWTPLLIAAAEGHENTVAALLDAGADPNVKNALGRTALMHASVYGFTAIVKLLLARGADPNLAPTDGQGWTALMAAARAGHVETVRALLNGGAKVALTDKNGNTALALAEAQGQTAVAVVLREHGGKP
jgi:hypothetical protein